ncbi:hypothetical protein AGDE_03760 [Angomonas deanei]|uniref:Uncharacterized protein n=1 Tax=Angomonas deanei TaxID=59799 RepID=S9VH59_9TRYP|nr:hypothetical protein AGDE_12438 [Angomonas deanei]EPY40168.1 hypothetical protein AGDE_03760 [Angomonas deanei]CAD2217435.1 hypothetical protein, conserved [Angomonas deanei]|eukprot:EPY24257.1 hypothetical protein AGDE_12438 [Angomonas deanei]
MQKKESSLIAKCVGNAEVLFSKKRTDLLTDLCGTFLVFCFAIYFTVAAYLFYREAALSEKV